LDLAAFDSFEIGKAIAQCPLPVFTGIGHEIDSTVADNVAHTSLKTPTAVADYLHTLNGHFADTVYGLYQDIGMIAQRQTRDHRVELRHLSALVKQAPRESLMRRRFFLDQMLPSLKTTGYQFLQKHKDLLVHANLLLDTLDPASTLRRGYTITVKDGKRVVSSAELTVGDSITTYFHQGRIKSTVKTHE